MELSMGPSLTMNGLVLLRPSGLHCRQTSLWMATRGIWRQPRGLGLFLGCRCDPAFTAPTRICSRAGRRRGSPARCCQQRRGQSYCVMASRRCTEAVTLHRILSNKRRAAPARSSSRLHGGYATPALLRRSETAARRAMLQRRAEIRIVSWPCADRASSDQ